MKLDVLKNIRGSMKTTIAGAVLVIFAGWMCYSGLDGTNDFAIVTFLFPAGITLFLKNENKKNVTESTD